MFTPFKVSLDIFSGPFDLLLDLIHQRKLDITEVSLHLVTDDFIAYIQAHSRDIDCETMTHFLVVATTLLEIKTLKLLPNHHLDEQEEAALLEIRDLLFARLLEYQAIKHVADIFREHERAALQSYPRLVSLEPQFMGLIPEVKLEINSEDLAAIAQDVFARQYSSSSQIMLDHVHSVRVSVAEQAGKIMQRFTCKDMRLSFKDLIENHTSVLEIVASFLAILELYRDKMLVIEQSQALGELHVGWTGERYTPHAHFYRTEEKKTIADRDQLLEIKEQ